MLDYFYFLLYNILVNAIHPHSIGVILLGKENKKKNEKGSTGQKRV